MSLIYFLLFGFIISSQPECGTTMKIDITSSYYDGLIPKSFNVSCTPEVTGNGVKKILAIQVARNGSRPLATLQQNSQIVYNPLLRSSVKAEGAIHTDAAKSELTVTFSNIVNQDSGMYTCTSIYLDKWGHFQQDIAYKNFTVENHDVSEIVRHLLGKLSSMETLVNTQKNQLVEQKDLLQSQQKQLVDQKDLLQTQQKQFVEQKDLLQTQLQAQQKQLMTQQSDIASLSNRTETYINEESFVCAFSAAYDGANLNDGKTILFGNAILNEGNHFNTTSGIFTAPRNGLYAFYLSARDDGGWVLIDLKANDLTVASVYVFSNDGYHDQASVSNVVSLQAGDKVRPVVRSKSNTSVLATVPQHSIFSGHLVKLL